MGWWEPLAEQFWLPWSPTRPQVTSTTFKRRRMDSAGPGAIIAGGVPLAIGLVWFASGLLKWTGIWKTWYTQPSRGGARLRAVIGNSPLPQLLAGLGLSLAGASLFIMALFPMAIVVGTTLGPLLILAGAVFVIYRPRWTLPGWMLNRS